jgi:PAS domain S-box-containing protein
MVRALLPDGIRAFADFPMITPEGQIGFLSVFYEVPHEFTHEEVDLLQTFASQAALWISNAKMYSSTDENLARRVHQLSILEAVGRDLSAAAHSESLFQLILNYAIEFTQSPVGGIYLYDFESELAQFKALVGYTNGSSLPMGKGITLRAIRTGKVENVDDVQEDPDFVDASEGKTKSQLSVPLRHEDNILGAITLEKFDLNAFSSDEQSLVEQLANQASVAIVNAELYSESQRHLKEQSALFQISAQLVGALDVGGIVEILFQALNEIVSNEYLGIYLWEEGVQVYQLHHAEYHKLNGKLLDQLPELSIKKLPLNDARIHQITANNLGEILSPQGFEGQTALVPLRVAQNLLGFVVIGFAGQYKLSEDTSRLIEAILSQGAIAIQNAQLFVVSARRRKQLAALINSVSDSIVMVNNDGIVTLFNQPAMSLTGLSSEAIAQTHIRDFSDKVLARLGYQRKGLIELFEDLVDGKPPKFSTEKYKIPDTEPEIVLERETLPVLGPGEQPMGWMIVWRDITEEYQVNKEREAIADALIHDLRSPVSVILGSIDLLDETIPSDIHTEIVDRSLQVARRSAKRVLRLIMSLLDVARMQAGRIELDRTAVDLAAMVPDLLTDIEMIADEYKISVNSEIAKDLPVIFVDEDKISRVIINLLDNAVKFSPENSAIKVAVRAEGNDIVFQIWDQGPGISDENRAIIFERFSQISGQLGRWRGAGLGLAFCRLAIEAHGGRIWVDDSPEGQGSVFSFLLPIRG